MKIYVFILFFLSTFLSLRAAHTPYFFYHISTQDGLSASNVKTILQDSYGFMWFGTKNGLNRFDGNSIVRFDCDDLKKGVSNHNISALFEDTQKRLWVGTDRGVYRYDLRKDEFEFISLQSDEGTSMDNWVANIVGDPYGNIWIVIPDQGVFRYQNEKLYHYQVSQHFKVESPSCICVCSDGTVYVGTWNAGISRYDKGRDCFNQIVKDSIGRSLLGLEINTLSQQGDDLYLSLQTGGVKKYSLTRQVLSDIPFAKIERSIVRNAYCFDGKVWIGTHDGLYVMDETAGTMEHLKQNLLQPYGLSDDIIYTMYQDCDGGIWLGTMFGGVCYYPKRDFTFQTYLSIDANFTNGKQRIRGLAQDKTGMIWIGTESEGINCFNPRTEEISAYTPAGKCLTLGMWTYGDKIYCGLYKQGLAVIDNGKYMAYPAQQLGLNEGSVYAFYIDSQGMKWIGSGDGLYRADAGSRIFSKVEETGYDWIFDIMEAKDGTLWMASMGSGLWKYDRKKQTYMRYVHEEGNSKSLSSNSISSIMEDSKGNIWLSTDRGGICRYNQDADDFTSFSLKEGFPDDVAYKILEDHSGCLWLGTNQGLLRFHPQSGEVRTFTVEDGLLGNQFNYKSAVKGKDGKFYFGSINGLVAFNPNVPEKSSKPLSAYISRFSIYNKEVTLHTKDSPLQTTILETDAITLPYDQSNISMDISVLSFFSSEEGRFLYHLLPADKDWICSDNSSKVSYANLSPGEYTFQVKPAQQVKGLPEKVHTLHISILPPWWQSGWAYLGYVLGVVACVLVWFFWYRAKKNRQLVEKQHLFAIEKEKELGQMKIDFFTEIAHEIRTPLTLINGPLEVIQAMHLKDEKLSKYIQVISSNTKRLLNLTAQLLDFQKVGTYKLRLNYELVNVGRLLEETIARFEPTIEHEDKVLEVSMPEEKINACVDKEAITKIISNLLNNARKYGRKHIRVNLSANDADFILKVSSDGVKIATEDEKRIFEPFYQVGKKRSQGGVGIGLSLSRSLTLLHKGNLYLEPGQTDNVFVLCVPLNLSMQSDLSMKQNEEMEQKEVLLQASSSVDKDNLSSYTLLVVEDDASISQFMAERLSEYFMVETASNGEEALKVLRSEHIDLVISDVMMPVMDGYELCTHIKSDVNLCHIPVVFLTAKNDLDSKLNGLKAGAEAYVEKPFSFDYLKNQISSLLENRQKEREAYSKRPFFPINNMQLSKEDEDFMEKVIAEINHNIADEEFGVEKLAALLCMSRSNLLRKIKTLFNLSPIEFIRLIRLKKAAQLIQEGQYRIGEIGAMVGFNSPSYFSRMFVKQFGMTPKEFERQVRK